MKTVALHDRILDLAFELLGAIADGKLTTEEARDVLAAIDEVVDVEPDEILAWAFGLVHRESDELEARAAELEAKGKIDRAAKLRERAAYQRKGSFFRTTSSSR